MVISNELERRVSFVLSGVSMIPFAARFDKGRELLRWLNVGEGRPGTGRLCQKVMGCALFDWRDVLAWVEQSKRAFGGGADGQFLWRIERASSCITG